MVVFLFFGDDGLFFEGDILYMMKGEHKDSSMAKNSHNTLSINTIPPSRTKKKKELQKKNTTS